MITADENRMEGVTHVTADSITDAMNAASILLDENMGTRHIARFADDLNDEYQGVWFDNRYKVTIIIEKV